MKFAVLRTACATRGLLLTSAGTYRPWKITLPCAVDRYHHWGKGKPPAAVTETSCGISTSMSSTYLMNSRKMFPPSVFFCESFKPFSFETMLYGHHSNEYWAVSTTAADLFSRKIVSMHTSNFFQFPFRFSFYDFNFPCCHTPRNLDTVHSIQSTYLQLSENKFTLARWPSSTSSTPSLYFFLAQISGAAHNCCSFRFNS